ncbi:MAG: hypothetical protein KF862_12655 [Chitinophagaceae bacterium]|nr:hypothetical protein [Chitinophagaceae bacterium]
MKSKSGVDSKAGTLKMKNNTKVLGNLISRSASMLLIAMAGFGMMSFTQDDTAVNSLDTGVNATTEVAVTSVENCCAVQVNKPGDEIKKAVYISMPRPKAMLTADIANSRLFVAEAKERRIWSMDLSEARANADSEMKFSFQLSQLNPTAAAFKTADLEMLHSFAEGMMLQFAGTMANNANIADAEMISEFMAAHFKIAVRTDAATLAKADAAIAKVFEKENLPFINLPSHIAAATADAAMLQSYEAEVKVITIVANK